MTGENIKPLPATHNGIRLRSWTEKRVCVALDAMGVRYAYEPEGFRLESGVCYRPDFLIPDWNVWLEVKREGWMNDSDEAAEIDRKAKELCEGSGKAVLVTDGALRAEMQGRCWFLYHDGRNLCMDSDNIMTMLREGGAKVPTGRKQQTYKAATQSGLLVNNVDSIFLIEGKQVPFDPINALTSELDFDKHLELVQSLGFALLVKRAKVGMAKHIRVRPMFKKGWQVKTRISVIDEQKSGITKEVLKRILDEGGALCGLGDWRPSGRTPGQFGRFSVELEEE